MDLHTPSLFDVPAPIAGSSLCAKLARYFEAREGQWVDARELLPIAGFAGWRTRISNLRKAPYRMVITNRTRRVHGHKAWCQMWDFSTTDCHCGGGTVTISEYRFSREA